MSNQKITSLAKLNQALIKGRLKPADLQRFFVNYADVQTVEGKVSMYYAEGMIDSTQLNEFSEAVEQAILDNKLEKASKNLPPISSLTSLDEMIESLFSGLLILYKDGDTFFYTVNISKIPKREPEESTSEISIKGPRDGFTEEVNVNVSLIRKRLKSKELYNQAFELGSISKTKVSLLYLKNRANSKVIKEIDHRLKKIQVDSIISSGQLEQWLSDRTFSLFPLFDYIARPDFVVESLLKGKFILIVDGSPLVLIGPVNLLELLNSPEDIHYSFQIIIFQKIFRVMGLFAAIFLPGFWVSITSVNIDQLPLNLLATIVESRQGMPLPFALEFIFILVLFEILREAGIQMPKPIGQTITVVGGLIIGDAVIRAGLASPTLIVVIAVSVVSTYTLVNQSLVASVSILRVYLILTSAILGVYGFILGLISILVYVCRLESFGISYVQPITEINWKKIYSSIFFTLLRKRKPNTLHNKK
ncbi:spore germination protein [Virgibacillus sp. SK37]|uniref:spore germination protein n=1 Tax=Virgibacillus sp. SK37 TaxID=403957 RepID=UPI0004D0B444|nr:spore germination protein [Virgibacillus sp. SK37]AIF43148.1 spore germination protein GerA [Virgibacillus sp. SK37]